MNEKLSKRQKEAIEKMKDGEWHSAYDLQVGINTLEALVRKGFVRTRYQLGSMAFPHNASKWQLVQGEDDADN